MVYKPGKFYAAMRSAASVENEQNIITVETPAGPFGVQTNRRSDCASRDMLEARRRNVARGDRIGLDTIRVARGCLAADGK